MPLEAPVLDRRNFDELLRQARLRIPRYTPEWTDHNDSDPGMTLVQLFAWLTEMMLYEMNQVPRLTYVKFLQLLNIELKPAQPATAHVTFTVQPNATQVGSVRRGTQLMATPAGGGDPLIFETEQGLDPIRMPLSDVRVVDGTGVSQTVTADNEQINVPYRPFGWVPQIGNALYLGFTPPDVLPDRPFPRELRFRVGLVAAGAPPAAISCRDARIAPAPPVGLVWEYRTGPESIRWQRLDLFEDESVAFTRAGSISVEGPAVSIRPVLDPARIDPPPPVPDGAEPRFWLRCRLAERSYPGGLAPEIDFIRPNTVPAINLATVRDELVGTGEGRPDQSFVLARRPVQPESLILTIVDPSEPVETWERKPDFLASGEDDPHYVLNATTGEIRFGNGDRGRIPGAGVDIVATQYRYGGGASGNVQPGEISTLLTSIPGIDAVSNDRPGVGGADEQSPEALAREAPRFLRHRDRAVTAKDFAALARQAGGVAKATALDLAHPDFPGVEVPGAVTVVIVPERPNLEDAIDDRKPEPSPDLLRSVCAYLDHYRLLTTEVYVKGPEYQEIKVEAVIEAEPYASFDTVARDVSAALNEYLDPLGRKIRRPENELPRAATAAPTGAGSIVVPASGGLDEEGWPFGRDLSPTSLFGVILQVRDVSTVRSLTLRVEGKPHTAPTLPVKVPRDGLIYSAGEHDINVVRRLDL